MCSRCVVAVRQRWPPCRLPEWLRAHHAWQSLNKHLQLQVGLHNVTLRRLRGHHRHHLHRHRQDDRQEEQDNDLHAGPRTRAQTDQQVLSVRLLLFLLIYYFGNVVKLKVYRLAKL